MYREWQVDKPNRRANAACRIGMPCRLGMMEWDSRLACRNGMLGWAPGVAYRKGLLAWLIEFTDGMKHSVALWPFIAGCSMCVQNRHAIEAPQFRRATLHSSSQSFLSSTCPSVPRNCNHADKLSRFGIPASHADLACYGVASEVEC